MSSMPSIPGRSLAVAILAAVALLGAGCQQKKSPHGSGTVPQAALVTGPTCTPGPTAHESHIGRFSCDTCHPCGGNVGFDEVTTFPRGTSTAGGTVVRSTPTTPANCTVACHFPMGQAARTVTWTTPGPLNCTECHALGSLPAAHPALPSSPVRADCQACHSAAGHMTGASTCNGCHGVPPQVQPSAIHPVYRFDAPCAGCHPTSTTVDASGRNALVAGGTHQDGTIQYSFAGHPAGWATPGFNGTLGGTHSGQACFGCGMESGFTMTYYYSDCTSCHGQAGDFTTSGGTSRVSCANCHVKPFFDVGGTTSCTFCH